MSLGVDDLRCPSVSPGVGVLSLGSIPPSDQYRVRPCVWTTGSNVTKNTSDLFVSLQGRGVKGSTLRFFRLRLNLIGDGNLG